MKGAGHWVRRLRLEEKAAASAFSILLLLEWRLGGRPRLDTYFATRGMGLLGAVAVLYSVAAVRGDAVVARRPLTAMVGRSAEFVRDWFPFVTLIVVYENLLPLIRHLRPGVYDEAVLRADRWLFGETPSVWFQSFITPVRTEWFALCYLGLFALPVMSAGVPYLAGRRAEFREFLLAFCAAGFLGYLGYLLVPVVGPRYYFPELYRVSLSGAEILPTLAPQPARPFLAIAEQLSHAAVHAGNQPPNCFPSLHTAWGLIALILAYRRRRWLFYIYLLPVGSLIFATLYLRFHYLVDVVAGSLLSVVVCAWATRASRTRDDALEQSVEAVSLPQSVQRAWPRVEAFLREHWAYAPLLFVALVYASSLPTGLTPRNAGQDGGELVTAAVVGGTAHPPGYPLYTLLLRGVCLLFPNRDAIDVAHAFSAALAVAAGGVVIRLVREWLGVAAATIPRWLSDSAACLAGLGLCFSRTLLSQAIIAEVYSLHALLVATSMLLATQRLLAPSRSTLIHAFASGGVAGLAISHHLTAVPVLTVELAVLFTSSIARRWAIRGLLTYGGGVLLGLLPWLYLPWAAAQAPVLSWGQPDSLERLLAVVSAAQYRSRLGGNLSECLSRLITRMPWRGASPLLLALATVGLGSSLSRLWSTRTTASRVGPMLALCALANACASSLYAISDLDSYFLPAEMATSALAGFGLAQVGASLIELLGPLWARRSTVVVAVCTLTLGLLTSLERADAHGQSPLDREVRAIIRSAPKDTLIVARGDSMVFGLWYERFVRSKRSDLDIVGRELLMLPWYPRQRTHFTPSMRFPASPLRGGPSARLLAVIAANYAFRPILVVHPADVPEACQRTRAGLLRCSAARRAELGG